MLGVQISRSAKAKANRETSLTTDPPTAEVSFEDSGEMLGVGTTGSAPIH